MTKSLISFFNTPILHDSSTPQSNHLKPSNMFQSPQYALSDRCFMPLVTLHGLTVGRFVQSIQIPSPPTFFPRGCLRKIFVGIFFEFLTASRSAEVECPVLIFGDQVRSAWVDLHAADRVDNGLCRSRSYFHNNTPNVMYLKHSHSDAPSQHPQGKSTNKKARLGRSRAFFYCLTARFPAAPTRTRRL